MALYNVHLYREMRLFFPRIEAGTPAEAARIASVKPTHAADCTEDCDGDNSAALVDVVGDDDFRQSATIDFEAERLRKAAPALLATLTVISLALRHYDHWLDSMPGQLLADAEAAIAKATAP